MSELHSLPQEIKQHIEEIARGIIPEAPDNMAPPQALAYNAQVRTILDTICENIEPFILLRLYSQGVRTVESTVVTETRQDQVVQLGGYKTNTLKEIRNTKTVTKRVSANDERGQT